VFYICVLFSYVVITDLMTILCALNSDSSFFFTL
jgi:hypothetical protein